MNTFRNFFKNQIAELHNVTWPTKKQAFHAVTIVLVIIVIVGIFLSILDAFLGEFILKLLNK